MTKLPIPSITASDVLVSLASQTREPRKSKVSNGSVTACVSSAETQYDSLLKAGNAFQIEPTCNIVGVLDEKDALQIYSDLKKIKHNGKPIRQMLLAASSGEKCAYCGMDRANTLDHYLPKKRYVELSFMPRNLVPCCQSCNGVSAKGEFYPLSAGSAIVHPYYEDTNDAQWLNVSIVVDGTHGLLTSYSVCRPPIWGVDKYHRVLETFKRLGLSTAYSNDLISKINDARTRLTEIFNVSGGAGLADYMSEWAGFSGGCGRMNNWLQIGFEAISADSSVCDQLQKWFPS